MVSKQLKKISFRIRRQYFDDIVSGKKKFELRKLSSFWIRRLIYNKPEVAVFVCGKDIHRRKIISISVGTPESYLGRELSGQGKKDIPTDMCIGTGLGDIVK